MKAAAKLKLKTHVKTRHGEEMEVTQAKIAYWFRIINVAVFNGTLPPPRIEIGVNMRKYWGLCTPMGKSFSGNANIKISDRITNRKLFISTVAHEMVHQYQWLTYGNMHHGDSYKKWSRYFKANFGFYL